MADIASPNEPNTKNLIGPGPPESTESTDLSDSVLPYHQSLNPTQPTTIILLHGLLSSHLEYAHVVPHLSSYHLLVPDLPGHSQSQSLPGPYTIPSMADTIATLISRRAHGGTAHIVGLSMGGFVTMDLARRYPDLCRTAFVTGAAPFEGIFKFMAKHPWLAYGIMWILDKIPDQWYWWMAERNGLVRHEELKREMGRNRRWEVVRAVYTSILGCLGWGEVRAIREVRTLNVAGGKQDDVQATKKVGQVWKESGVAEATGSRAVVVRDALHAWDLQMPELFAEGVKAWIEGRELPEKFEELD